jgi:hypothetical protein
MPKSSRKECLELVMTMSLLLKYQLFILHFQLEKFRESLRIDFPAVKLNDIIVDESGSVRFFGLIVCLSD